MALCQNMLIFKISVYGRNNDLKCVHNLPHIDSLIREKTDSYWLWSWKPWLQCPCRWKRCRERWRPRWLWPTPCCDSCGRSLCSPLPASSTGKQKQTIIFMHISLPISLKHCKPTAAASTAYKHIWDSKKWILIIHYLCMKVKLVRRAWKYKFMDLIYSSFNTQPKFFIFLWQWGAIKTISYLKTKEKYTSCMFPNKNFVYNFTLNCVMDSTFFANSLSFFIQYFYQHKLSWIWV